MCNPLNTSHGLYIAPKIIHEPVYCLCIPSAESEDISKGIDPLKFCFQPTSGIYVVLKTMHMNNVTTFAFHKQERIYSTCQGDLFDNKS